MGYNYLSMLVKEVSDFEIDGKLDHMRCMY